MAADSTTDAALGDLRNLLEANDRALLDLVNRRLELVSEIKQRKAELGADFVDPEREAWLLEHLRAANKGRLSDEGLQDLLTTVLDLTKRELDLMSGSPPFPATASAPRSATRPSKCSTRCRIDVAVEEHPFGGHAIHEHGDPLPAETLAACRAADAVLLGAAGLPEFDGAPVRPEQGLIRLRGELDVYANLRPARGDGIDLLIVRELVGGLYFGASGRRADGSAFDTCEYSPAEIERIARRGFELARGAPIVRHVGRQGERARDVTPLARGRLRPRGRILRRAARAHARRQRRHAARPSILRSST